MSPTHHRSIRQSPRTIIRSWIMDATDPVHTHSKAHLQCHQTARPLRAYRARWPSQTRRHSHAFPATRRRGGGRMCEGKRLAGAARPTWAAAELRRREALADAHLAAARARLAEALAELERARARAAELQRRLEETYGKRRRLKRVAAAVGATRARIQETRARLQEQQLLPSESDPDTAAASSSSNSSSQQGQVADG